MKTPTKKLVIVGGGFAGLTAAKALGRFSELDITLVDQKNHHLFQPLLYQVATAALSPADIAVPIRSILSGFPRVKTRLGKVKELRLPERKLIGEDFELAYDFLILACGSSHSYFGRNEWEEFAPGLKSLEEATEIRRRILLCFEEAEKEKSPERKKMLQTFVVVGGGPTGVELAGAIAEMSRYTLTKDFRNIDSAHTQILLVEAGPRILPSFDASLAEQATDSLRTMGVQVRTNCRVTDLGERGVQMNGAWVESRCVLWAAGVKPSLLNEQIKDTAADIVLDRQGRIPVQADLSLKSHPEVFVLGDQAHCEGPYGQPLPGLASVALQQGRHVARVIRASLESRPRPPFRYRDKGQMATIGRGQAIVQSGKFRSRGFVAWLTWLFVHIYYLIGFENRLLVFIHWAWNYLTFHRGARLIISKEWRSVSRERSSS